MIEHIKKWIDYVSLPQDLLGGLSICPFAKKAKFRIIRTSTTRLKIPEDDFEIIIFKVEDKISEDDLMKFCKEMNKMYKELIFLPDHKNRETFINRIKTSNNKYNFILCQKRDKLEEARELLKKTNYYSYWNKSYLNEITGM